METHFQKLSYYGQRLRDRLMVYNLRELTRPVNRGEEGALWSGWPNPLMSDPPTDDLERQIEHGWVSRGRYNARKHFIAKDFQQHLSAHPCWQALEQVESSFQKYRKAGEDFYNGVLDKVSNQLKEKIPDVSESYRNVIAGSLMVDACSGGRINFLYRHQKVTEATGQLHWRLELDPPDWSIEPEVDPGKLTLIAELHQALSGSLAKHI